MGSKLEVIDISGRTSYLYLSFLFRVDSVFKGWFRNSSDVATTTSRYVGKSKNKEFALKKYHSKVSVLSGRYFKLTDKEAENKERKISDVGIFGSLHPISLISYPNSQALQNLASFLPPGLELDSQLTTFLNCISGHWSNQVILLHLSYIILGNSSASEQVRCSGSPSPGHGDGCRGPGGFPESPSQPRTQERISAGVNLLGLERQMLWKSILLIVQVKVQRLE